MTPFRVCEATRATGEAAYEPCYVREGPLFATVTEVEAFGFRTPSHRTSYAERITFTWLRASNGALSALFIVRGIGEPSWMTITAEGLSRLWLACSYRAYFALVLCSLVLILAHETSFTGLFSGRGTIEFSKIAASAFCSIIGIKCSVGARDAFKW